MSQTKHNTSPLQKFNRLMMLKEIISVYTGNYTKLVNTKCGSTDC
jgi:hypothetical protein